jgi:hypothetical protein
MSDSKKPKLSEIKAWSEMASKREWDIKRITYLLDLVKRMGEYHSKQISRIETLLGRMRACNENNPHHHDLSLSEGEAWVEEARELLKEIEP